MHLNSIIQFSCFNRFVINKLHIYVKIRKTHQTYVIVFFYTNDDDDDFGSSIKIKTEVEKEKFFFIV